MNFITTIIISLALVGALIYSVKISEVSECENWKEQSYQYTGFFLSQWQADQCSANDIEINAPVR